MSALGQVLAIGVVGVGEEHTPPRDVNSLGSAPC
jgi:hypothetical protein